MAIWKSNSAGSGRGRRWVVGVVLGWLAVWGLTWAGPPQEAIDRTITSADLIKAQGRRISQGSNTEATGPLGVKSYRLDEITLAKPFLGEVKGEIKPVKKVFRLIITTEPFPVRAIPPAVWIGDKKVDTVIEGENLDQFIAFILDESVLRDGATLAVAFGEGGDSRSVLKEKLKLGDRR